jgi:hypothetical protein
MHRASLLTQHGAMQVFAMIFSSFTDTFGSPDGDFMSNVSKIGESPRPMPPYVQEGSCGAGAGQSAGSCQAAYWV